MTEQRECYQCRGRGSTDSGRTCLNCGGRGWKNENVSESGDSGPEPLFFKTILSTGIILGLTIGGYFGWSVGGIGGALTYGALGAVGLGICAGLFSTFLRILIKICIGIGIIVAINYLWGKGNPEMIGSKPNTTQK